MKIYGATLSSPKGDPSGGYGTAEGLANRLVINAYIRTSGLFDGVEDFDAATYDRSTGGIWPQFVPNSTTGGTTGDYLRPNRAGYQAEANSISLRSRRPNLKSLNWFVSGHLYRSAEHQLHLELGECHADATANPSSERQKLGVFD